MSTNSRDISAICRLIGPAIAAACLFPVVVVTAASAAGRPAAVLMPSAEAAEAETWEVAAVKRRVPYRKEVQFACPAASPICDHLVDTVGKRRRLEIAAVFCVASSSGDPIFFSLNSSTASDVFVPVANSSGLAVVDFETRFTVKARRELSLTYAATNAVGEMVCVVSGQMDVLK